MTYKAAKTNFHVFFKYMLSHYFFNIPKMDTVDNDIQIETTTR